MSRFAELLEKEDREFATWISDPGRALPDGLARPLSRPSIARFPQADSGTSRIDWLQAAAALKKYWRTSALFASAVMVTVLLVTLFTKPEYEPSAKLEIDPPGAELFSMEVRGGSDSSSDYLETQARNLQSDQLLISVIRQLHLDQASAFTERGPLSRGISAVLASINNVSSRLWAKKSVESGTVDSQALTPEEAASLTVLQNQLTVKRDTASRLITVSVASPDPVLSATVTNGVVRCFIDRTYQTRHNAIMQSTEWLSHQLDDIRTKMVDSNRALTAFQGASGITDVDQNRSTFTEQMAELSRQKTQAQAERIQIESYLRRANGRDAANLPQIQNNQVVTLLTQRLGEARAELSQTLALYGKNHPTTKKIQNQVEELESQIQLQRNAIVGQMETSHAAALAREQMIDNQMRGTSRELGQMARYTSLKKEAEANADLYNALYARVKEAGIAAASKSINMRIVDEARILGSPTRPRPLLNFGLGLFVSLLGGLLIVFVRQAMDTRVHTLEDVRQSIGISAVSMVPIAGGNGHASLVGSMNSLFGGTQQRKLLDGPANFILDQPGSEQSEAIRGIQTSVMFSQPGHPPRVLLVASSVPGEGKTTVAINLAVALAQHGTTCLLDADLRRPSIARAFHITAKGGLGESLSDAVPVDSLLTPVPAVARLSILAACKPMSDPCRFINSENFKTLVSELRSRFEYVVIDSTPILPYADGRAMATLVDGVIFVGRAGIVTRQAMARSMELLQQVHSAPILEVVLNGAHVQSEPYGYHYKYDYSPPSPS